MARDDTEEMTYRQRAQLLAHLEVAMRALRLRLWGHLGPPEWHGEAACRHEDWRLWAGDEMNREPALRMCRNACPVRRECLADVIRFELAHSVRTHHPYGVAGGLTAQDRRELYKRMAVGSKTEHR